MEEVLRIEGYDQIPAVPFAASDSSIAITGKKPRYHIRDVLVNRGIDQVITWSFMSDQKAKAFGGIKKELILTNPISQELNGIRPTIIPNLLEVVQRNKNRGIHDSAVFEIGPQYHDNTPQGQILTVTGIRSGKNTSSNWHSKEIDVDLYDAKSDVLAALESCGINIDSVQYDTNTPSWYHHGRSGAVKQGQNILAYFGDIHPLHLKDYDLTGPVVAFEILPDNFPIPKKRKGKPKLQLSSFQAVERDFSFIVDEGVPAQTLVNLIKKVNPQMIENVEVFDVFMDEALGKNKKSIAFRIRLQPQDQTLTEQDLIGISQAVIENVEKQTGGKLRQ